VNEAEFAQYYFSSDLRMAEKKQDFLPDFRIFGLTAERDY